MDGNDSGLSDDAALSSFLGGGLRERLGLDPEHLGLGLIVARNHLARGAVGDALRIYGTLVLCDPANADFQLGLADCASIGGEHHIALQAASALIATAPGDPRGYLLSGRSCLMLGHAREAHEDLTDALRIALSTGDDAVAGEARLLLDRLEAVSAE